ncbi:outer membrane protein assembly factor BamB family protein [Corynebacterium sp. A21]|uniref:outer membrane protein assembly factor BamB family protein n=1 Tax=Corynebacterium sp. A21 TaxID=3457318 RepID=UPI003FD02A67
MHGRVVGPNGPLNGIAVSNTVDVVETDLEGNFDLPDRGKFVMVSAPENFRAEDWWKPATSQAMEFVLEPRKSTSPYRFIHLTDIHLSIGGQTSDETARRKQSLYSEGTTPAELKRFFNLVEEEYSEIDAVFVTGDLVDLGIDEEFIALKKLLAECSIEVHVIPGNHDHMAGRSESVVSPNNYLTNAAYPENYERHFGPRWFSFNVPGLHVVSLDWLTFELGMDTAEQLEWLRQDLASIPSEQPWALLFHDQPSSTLLDHVPRLPIATFSGHWHTSRIVKVDGVLHVNTPPTFFGGLDYSPPMIRFMTWDGSDFEIDSLVWQHSADTRESQVWRKATIRSGGAILSPLLAWQTDIGGAGHRQTPVVAGDRVFVGSQFEDGVGGAVEAFRISDGTRLWRYQSENAVKATPVLVGGKLIVHEVTGDVVALDAGSGEQLWKVPSSDPLRRFAWGSPVAAGTMIVVGDQADLRAIDATSGDVIWRRTDIAPHHNLVNHSAPLIHEGRIFVGFWPSPDHPVGLNLSDGSDAWARTSPEVSEESLGEKKRLLIMGTASHDALTDSVLMPAFSQTISLDSSSGAMRWSAPNPGRFSPSTPIPTPKGILSTVIGHGLQMLDSTDGSVLWEFQVKADSPFPMQPYSKGHGPVLAQPTLVDDQILLPGLDGKIRILSLDGKLLAEKNIGLPMASPLSLSNEYLLGLSLTGCLFAVELKGLRCL